MVPALVVVRLTLALPVSLLLKSIVWGFSASLEEIEHAAFGALVVQDKKTRPDPIVECRLTVLAPTCPAVTSIGVAVMVGGLTLEDLYART